jgi:hypothetical protein
MTSISQKFKNTLSHLDVTRKNIVPFVIFLVIVLITFIGTGLSSAIAPATFTLVFSVLCMFVWFLAGIAVFRALMVAGISFSIVVFLAQTYCGLPVISQTADESLKILVAFGLIYSFFLFIHTLYKELKGDSKFGERGGLKLLEDIYDGKQPWLILVLYAVFIGLFLFQLYQVFEPIVLNFCIYQ